MIEHLPPRYTVLGHIGSGAMGELYRAHDTRLGRDVAIKMLRPEFARDPDRRHRLRREAQLLAAVEHPNIASIFDLEESDGTLFLVLEYIAGTTLAEHIGAGPMPMTEALSLARQLAEGLEAAHAQGVVHRDLKPANVILAAERQVKILDFGLARSTPQAAPVGDPWEPSSLTHDRTREGALLGTVGYMSPEQARGLPADRRADIWAFGCILYELLTGQRSFRGDTPTDTLVRIIEHDPDWGALPPEVPAGVRVLLRRCLAKDVRFRLRDIGEAWVAIVRALEGGEDDRPATVPGRRTERTWRPSVAAASLLLLSLVGALGWWAGVRNGAPTTPRLTYELPFPNGPARGGRVGPGIAISPDERQIVWVDQHDVWVHLADSLGFHRRAFGHAGFDPVFSPDGRWLAIRAEGAALCRMLLADGSLASVAPASTLRGVAWGPDDSLVYAPGFGSGLCRVSARGGAIRTLTTLDSARGEVTHRWPDILPDGRTVLFTVRTRFQPSFDRAEIALLDLRTGRRRTLLQGGTCPRYVRSGHLVFARGDRLLAVPFDIRTGRLVGTPATVLEGIDVNPTTGAAQYACSPKGTLVYCPLPPGGWTNRLAWVDRRGRSEEVQVRAGLIEHPDVSPDGRHVAFTLLGAQNDIAVFDLALNAVRRLTFDPREDTTPIWTPDGSRVTFASAREGPLNLYWTRLDGAAAEERLTRSSSDQAPSDWSPDGRTLLFTQDDPTTGTDLWRLDPRRGGGPVPFLRTPFTERAATFSPCGRWVAYESNETGQGEIYVRPLERADRRWQVSDQGGSDPQWSPDGGELYFARGDDMMVARVDTRTGFNAGPASVLFRTRLPAVPAVTPDGRRFITITQSTAPDRAIVRTGWFEDLERLAPR